MLLPRIEVNGDGECLVQCSQERRRGQTPSASWPLATILSHHATTKLPAEIVR